MPFVSMQKSILSLESDIIKKVTTWKNEAVFGDIQNLCKPFPVVKVRSLVMS